MRTLSVFMLVFSCLIGAVGCSEKKSGISKDIGPIFQIKDDFIVNLAKTDMKTYLKANIALELEDDKMMEEIAKKNIKVRDIIIDLLSARTVADISEEIGKQNLKEDIISELNAILEDGKVLQVYFNTFVVQ